MAHQQVRAPSWKHKSASGVTTRRIWRPGEWYLGQVNMNVWKPLSSPGGCSFLCSIRGWGHVKTMLCLICSALLQVLVGRIILFPNMFFHINIFLQTDCGHCHMWKQKVWQIGKDEQAVQAKPEELGDPSIMPTIYILHLSLFWLHFPILTKARYLAIILDTFYHIFYFDSNIRHPRLTRWWRASSSRDERIRNT